jgi:hypothetical protein
MKPTMLKCTRMARGALLAALAFVGLSQAPHALADTMLISDTTLVRGSSSAVFSFDAPTAGMVTATLSNLPWPNSLTALNFAATTSTDVISSWSALDSSNETKSESFLVGPGTYFAHIMANASTTGGLNLGLYSLNLTFSPNVVPLPASDWMLLTGVLVLFGLTRVMGLFGRFQVSRPGPVPAH